MMRVPPLSGTFAHTMHDARDAGNACSTWPWRTGVRTWLLRDDIWHHSHARYRRRLFQTHAPDFLGTPCIPVIYIASAVPCLAFGTAVFGPIKVTNRRNEVSQEFGRRENVLLAIDTPFWLPWQVMHRYEQPWFRQRRHIGRV
jgi:hypothetical protein